MKILMLTPYLPYPPSSGGQIRTFNLLKYLSKNNNITLISLYKTDEEKKYISEIEKFCTRIIACKRAEKPWQPINIIKAVFGLHPFLVVRNFSEEAERVVKKLLSEEQFDVIHAETFYVMPHLPETKIPVLLVEQTIEYQVYLHFVESLPFIIRPLFYLDIFKLTFWERYYWRKASLVSTVSLADLNKIRDLEPKTNLSVVPNGAGEDMMNIPLISRNLSHPTLLFVGHFSWLQNSEATEILWNYIFPLVKKKIKGASLIIAGQKAKEKLRLTPQHDAHIIDLVPDDKETVRKLYTEATLLIAPIHGPGGTRLKILAALAAGLPIISTRTGIEGLDLADNRTVLLAEKPEEFADNVISILSDKEKFNRIQKNAYTLVREKYNWEKIAQQLEQYYTTLRV